MFKQYFEVSFVSGDNGSPERNFEKYKNKNSLVLRMLVALSDFLQTIYRINYLFQIVPGEMHQTLLAVTKSTT